MLKSIEAIWKEGFLKNDALLAPKLNNLYNKKSIDIVDKFKRMYEINRIGIVAFIILPMSFYRKNTLHGNWSVPFIYGNLRYYTKIQQEPRQTRQNRK